MKTSIIIEYAVVLVLAALLSACAGPNGDSGSSNANAPQQANGNTPPSTPLALQTLPPPQPKADGDSVKPAEKPAADRNANTANASSASSVRAPKLVAPEKKIDFGKQPQDKTLVRAIAIRNGGRAVLNIESVVPS
jgi:hypothetical protein